MLLLGIVWQAQTMQLLPMLPEAGLLQGRGSEACDATLRNDKEFDLIVYGATGFTGKLAAKYLSSGLPGAPRWAVGGRKRGELANLSAELAARGPKLGPSIFVADLQDLNALQEMTQRARVVLTYAGPYEEYGGENLIKAALSTCTNYVDITGETAWKVQMLQKYSDEAQARGLVVVQSAGLDSLPADLVSMLAAEEVAADGKGPPTEVAVFWSKGNGLASGGTLASGIYQATHHLPSGLYDLAPGATQVSPKQAVALFDEEHFPYAMSQIDIPVIHRSMSLRFPGAGISVSEDTGASYRANLATFLADPRLLTEPPASNPKPGEGPPEWMLEEGSFANEARARRASDGHTAAIRLDGANDPGYQACAKFSVEFSLGLARAGPAVFGFPTPSLALGPSKLRDILEEADGGRLMNFTVVPASPQ